MALASALQDVPHFVAFDTMAQEVFSGIDLSVAAMYLLDSVPAEALPALAEQFNVLGWKGWLFADTEAKRRALIRSAIAIQQKKGTAWSIRQALVAVGYLGAEFVPQTGVVHDGSIDYDGAETYAGGFWANFLIRVWVPQDYTPVPQDDETVGRIVEEYKPARCNMTGIEYVNIDA